MRGAPRGRYGAAVCADLAYAAAAFAPAGLADAQLFTMLAREAEVRVGEFNSQDLANLAWAFATAGESSALLFEAFSRESESCLSVF